MMNEIYSFGDLFGGDRFMTKTHHCSSHVRWRKNPTPKTLPKYTSSTQPHETKKNLPSPKLTANAPENGIISKGNDRLPTIQNSGAKMLVSGRVLSIESWLFNDTIPTISCFLSHTKNPHISLGNNKFHPPHTPPPRKNNTTPKSPFCSGWWFHQPIWKICESHLPQIFGVKTSTKISETATTYRILGIKLIQPVNVTGTSTSFLRWENPLMKTPASQAFFEKLWVLFVGSKAGSHNQKPPNCSPPNSDSHGLPRPRPRVVTLPRRPLGHHKGRQDPSHCHPHPRPSAICMKWLAGKGSC